MDTKLKILGKKNVHSIRIKKDSRWTIKDKIFLYKGILRLQGRQKNIKTVEAAKLRKKICKELKTLKIQVKEFRTVLKEVQCGDKRKLHTILGDHKDLQLAYGDRDPSIVYHAVYDNCDFKRKQLNGLYHLKSLKIKEFFDLKLQWTLLMDEYKDQNSLKDLDPHEQIIAYCYDKAIANKQAAESLRFTYLFVIDILEKDRHYFDVIIKALEDDGKEQRQIITKAKQVGQLAAQDLNDTRGAYKKMAVLVWKNIREREKTLKIIRERVENLWSDVRLLVRVESDTKYIEKICEKPKSIKQNLEEDVRSLEEMFQQVKDILQTQSYVEFLARFEDQARQKTRLLKLLEKSLEERDSLLNKKNNAVLILGNLKDSMMSTNGNYDEYKTSKKEILYQLEMEKKREADFTKLKKSRGALLINIKTALQNMLAMMVCVKPGWGGKQKSSRDKKLRDKKGRRSETKIDRNQFKTAKLRSLSNDECELEKVDTNAINLLTQVMKKATILYGMSNFELSPEEEKQAKNLYQSYVAEQRSKTRFSIQESEFKTLTVDHEVLDATIATRADIKYRSKHIIEANTKID